MNNPVDDFIKFFVTPIRKIGELPDEEGGIVVFIVALALYDRLIVAKLASEGIKPNDENKRKKISKDLNITDGQARVFWDMFRNGLLHEAMPKTGKVGYKMRASYGPKPIFESNHGREVICINPLKFAEHIFAQFLDEPKLITSSVSFPLAVVASIPENAYLATEAGDILTTEDGSQILLYEETKSVIIDEISKRNSEKQSTSSDNEQ